MAFLYGLLRALAAAMRMTASVRQARTKDRYERAQQAFEALENDCKAHEVRVGRAVDFGDQLRLLKAYEAKEQSRGRWVRAAKRLEARKAREAWLKQLNGRKLPYTFGLVDMATVFYFADRIGASAWNAPEWVERLLTLL